MVWPKFKNKLDSETFANISEDLRKRALLLPIDATVTSTIRTPEYNKSVGGVPNSQHLTGGALDYRIRDLPPAKVALLKKHFTDAGFQVINEGDHLHVQHAKGAATNADAPLQDPNKLPALPSISGRTPVAGKSARGPLQAGYSTAQLSDAMFPDLGGFGLAAMRGAGQATSNMINTGIEGAAYFNPMNQAAMFTKAIGIDSPINAQQEILNNLFKSTLKKAAGTDIALAAPPTPFELQNKDPLLSVGGYDVIPSAGSIAYGLGNYAPEMVMTAYGAGPAASEALASRLPVSTAPAVAKSLSNAAATSAGAFTGGMLKGDPQEAYLNAVTFPAMQLGLEGAGYYAKQAGNYLKETPFLQNQRGSIGVPPKGGLPGEATPGQVIGPDNNVSRATVPEAKSTLLAQIESAKAGLSKAVLITPGEVVPEIPKGLVSEVTSAGTFIFDPTKISKQTIQRKVSNGSFGELLGHVEPKSAATTQAVAALDPVTGTELKTSMVSPKNVAKQTKVLQEQFPQAQVVSGGGDITNGILQQRLASAPSGKELKFIDTVRQSPNTAKQVAEKIAGNYDPITNPETLSQANAFIAQDFEKAISLAKSNEPPTAFSNTVAQSLVLKLQEAGRIDDAIEIVQKTASKAKDSGQAVQALSIFNRLTPEGILRYAEKQFQSVRESSPQFQKFLEQSPPDIIKNDLAKNAIAKKFNLPSLTPELATKLLEQAKKIELMPEGRAKQVATQQMLKSIADEIPPTFLKKVASFQVLNQLLNLKTFNRNIIGNTAFNALENANQVLATGIDKGVSKILGTNRTVTLPNLKEQASGAVKGLKEGMQDAMLGIDTSSAATQFDLPKGQVFKSFPLKQAEQLLNMSLKVPDRAFTEAAIQGDIANQIKLAKINGVVPNMEQILKHAKQVGEYRTFQDSTFLGKAFSGIKKYLNLMTGSEDFGAGNIVLNYTKMPANLINRGVAYTPANYARAVYEAGKGALGKGFDQEAFVNSISRATIGSGIISLGYFLAKSGLMVGRPTSDTDLRNLEKDIGKSGYQINVSGLQRFAKSGNIKDAALQDGDNLTTFDWLQPNAIQLAIGANHALKEDGDLNAVSSAVEAAKSGIDTLSEQPLISSLASVFGNKSRDKSKVLSDAAEVLFTSAGASFTNSTLRQTGQLLDNTKRNPYDSNVSQYALNLIKAKIPGLAQTLPVKHGSLGQELQNYQDGSNTFFNVFLNPSFSTTYKPTPEAKMVIYLNKITGETKQVPRQLSYKQTMQGLTIKLDPIKYEELQKVTGEMTKQVFIGLANDPKFTSKPANEQVKILGNKLTDIGRQAKILVLGDEFKSLAVKESAFKSALVEQEIDAAKFDKKADSYFDKIKDLPQEKLRQEINNLRSTDYRLYKELKQRESALKSQSIPVDDAQLKQLGVDNGFRAKQIIKNTFYMNDAEKSEYFDRLRRNKILTPFIQRQISQMQNTQQ